MLALWMWAARSFCAFFILSVSVEQEERVLERLLRQLFIVFSLCTSGHRWPKFGRSFSGTPPLVALFLWGRTEGFRLNSRLLLLRQGRFAP